MLKYEVQQGHVDLLVLHCHFLYHVSLIGHDNWSMDSFCRSSPTLHTFYISKLVSQYVYCTLLRNPPSEFDFLLVLCNARLCAYLRIGGAACSAWQGRVRRAVFRLNTQGLSHPRLLAGNSEYWYLTGWTVDGPLNHAFWNVVTVEWSCMLILHSHDL